MTSLFTAFARIEDYSVRRPWIQEVTLATLLACTSVVAMPGGFGMEQDGQTQPGTVDTVPITLEQAIAWRDELMPLVERITDRTFKGAPPILIADAKGIQRALENEAKARLQSLGNSSKQSVDLQLRLELSLRAATMAAKYAITDGAILVSPGNLALISRRCGLDPQHREAASKLAIARGLGQAMLFQHVEKQRYAAPRTANEADALDATIEGFGLFVQEKAAAELGFRDVHGRLKKLLEGADPSQAATPAVLAMRDACLGGLAFFITAENAGGRDRIWQILADPPSTMAQILQPKAAAAIAEPPLDATDLFEGFVDLLDADGWHASSQAADPESAARPFAVAGAEAVEFVRRRTTGAQTMLLMQGQNVRSITCFTLRDAHDVSRLLEFIDAMRQAQFTKLDELRKSGAVEVNQSRSTLDLTVDGMRGFVHDAVLVQQGASKTAGPTHVTIASAARGSQVVMLGLSGAPLPPQKVHHLFRTLLDRADAGAHATAPATNADQPTP